MAMLTSLKRYFKKRVNAFPSVDVEQIDTYELYKEFSLHQEDHYCSISKIEKSLIPAATSEFTVKGTCYVCQQSVNFNVDFKFSWEPGIPNWRERLQCPICGLNNRMRATIQLFEQECLPSFDSKMFVTEQLGPLYSWLRAHYQSVIGSEFLGDEVPRGKVNNTGVRNEDLTNLSFGEQEFDFILSFDVLEHIPDYQKALRECLRCLKSGGVFYFSIPFLKHSKEHVIRAEVDEKGKIRHLLPPEYHGDPLNSAGILCFHQFGWKLLDDLRGAGFSKATALLYWSRPLGYLGGEQVLLKAQK